MTLHQVQFSLSELCGFVQKHNYLNAWMNTMEHPLTPPRADLNLQIPFPKWTEMYEAWSQSIRPIFFFQTRRRLVPGMRCKWPCTSVPIHELLPPAQTAQLAKTSCCAWCTDNDQESWAAHLHQVLPETWALMLSNLQYDSEGFWEWSSGPYRS